MSLPLLVAVVAVGITLIILAIHLSGGSRRAKLADASQAMARFADDFPGESIDETVLTAAGETAFLALSAGRTGIVHAIGDRFLTRIVAPGDVASCAKAGETGLAVRIADFTFAGGNFSFADAAAADRAASLLSGQRAQGKAVEAA